MTAALDPVVGVPKIVGARVLDDLSPALAAALGSLYLDRSSDTGDSPKSLVEKRLRGQSTATATVDQDGIDVESHRCTIDGNDVTSPGHELADVASVTGGGKDDAGHVLAHGDVEIALFLRGILVGVAQHDRVAGSLGDVLYTTSQRSEERILDVRDDQGDDLGVLPAQRPGRAARGESQLVGRLRTRRAFSSDTRIPLNTRDTVAGETPARAATS